MNALRVETCMLYMYFKETSLISHASLESSNKESINQNTSGHCRRWRSRMEVKIVAGSLFVHCKIAYFYSVTARAGVKYVLSNTNTNTNTKIWIFQIQIQIQIFCSTLIQIQIQIQIHWFKYKYVNTFNQIYLPKLFRSKIGQFYESQDICSWPVFPYV